MKGKQIALLIFLGLLFLVSVNTFYSVHETKQAIVLQFGRPVGAPITDAGLKIKVPFIQQVQFLDRRILDLDSPAEEVIASDQKRLVVDSFTRWQISDPLQFYISVRDERIARSRLQAIVSSSLRSVLGGEEFVTVVRDERDELMDSIEYDWDKDGGVKGVKMMNKTITKWLRTCLDGGCSDKELVKWSMIDRTSAFLKIQEELTLGEGKASK